VRKLILLLLLASIACFGATITITSPKITGYTVKAGLGGWNGVMSGLGATFHTEDFDNYTLVPGMSIVSTYRNPYTTGILFGGWESRVAPASQGLEKDEFNLPGPSIGAYFTSLNMSGGGFGSGIDVYVSFVNSGYTKVAYLSQFGVNEQWGFIANEMFTSVTFQGGVITCCRETYGMDDMTWGAKIPEPGTYALMGAGLLALAGLARRRKA
jgi:hypothetical protein